MNERIRELIQMADLCAAGLMASGASEEEIQNRSKIVLAGMIVRECAGICHKMAEDSDSYVVHDGDTCAEQIKKHFGVKR